jgi:drug/metabolite transporter (DMT)-like permease
MNNIPWWVYVILAGLAWGTYVPIIFFGGQMLSPLSPQGTPLGIGGRLASILSVGVAYVVLAVVLPIALMATRDDARPDWRTVGLVFSGLAGVAGAVGAICVIFASKAAVDEAKAYGVNPATYRVYIAPLIFCLAPLINTVLSTIWHPNTKTGDWAIFHFEMPGWKLWVGIVFVAAGTFLVLKSKEDMEASKGAPSPAPAPAVPAPSDQPAPTPAGGS